MVADRTEMHNVAAEHPKEMKRLLAMYEDWAKKSDVQPWDLVQKKFAEGKQK
jgi:hypothetical protein